jgi:hypothetical protein
VVKPRRHLASPNVPGLYRIRRVGSTSIDYIGQTGAGGMTLRRRVAMLRGLYGAEMAYRDPHTAGPALWVLLQIGREEFEVSVAPVEGSNAWRRALEALTIALYRQEFGGSPTVNFGRMPSGYRMSSGNNRRLVAAGRRFREGPLADPNWSHRPGIGLAPVP